MQKISSERPASLLLILPFHFPLSRRTNSKLGKIEEFQELKRRGKLRSTISQFSYLVCWGVWSCWELFRFYFACFSVYGHSLQALIHRSCKEPHQQQKESWHLKKLSQIYRMRFLGQLGLRSQDRMVQVKPTDSNPSSSPNSDLTN